MPKNVYYDPFLGSKANLMKYRSDVVESQLEHNAAHARDIEAAKEAEKQQKRGFFVRLFRKKNS